MSTENASEDSKVPTEEDMEATVAETEKDTEPEPEPHAHVIEPPAEKGHKHSSSSSSLHNAKGWDGKLRVEKRAVLVNPEVLDGSGSHQSDAEDSDDDAVPVDQIEADEGALLFSEFGTRA